MRQIFKARRSLLLLLFPLSFLCLFLAKTNDKIAEKVFARGIYHYYSIGASWIFGWVPVSVAEILLLLLIFSVFIYLIRLITGRNKGKGKLAVLNFFCFASVLFFLYTIGCGVNYYRYPFTYYSNLTIQESTEEELYNLCVLLSDDAAECRKQIDGISEDEVYRLTMSKRELSLKVRDAYESLSGEYAVLSGHYPAAKPLLFSHMMSEMNLTGIFMPLTMEANVNDEVPDYSLASTMAHELTHLHGFMREDEANYIAYLACTVSDVPEIRYSGIMEALVLAGNALYAKNSELYYKMAEHYSDGMRLDFIDNSRYWEQFEDTVVSNTAEKVNNTYLKANAQEDGTRSYGRMVDLLLAKYRADNND